MEANVALVGLVGVLLLAGCTASPGALEASAAETPAPAPVPTQDFRVELRGCIEGGGQTVYNQDYVFFTPQYAPPEWQPADVREDVGGPNPLGGPLFATPGDPVRGPAHGYYHATVLCEEWTFRGVTHPDWMSGHVGIRVEPPPFDPGGAERHYLISTLPFADDGVRSALEALGYHATSGSGVLEPDPWHSVLFDELNGTYTYARESPLEDMGPVPDHVVRIWNLVPVGELWKPMALDMLTLHATHLGAPSGGTFTHQHIEDPPPQDPGPFKPFESRIAGLGWSGFDRVLTPGPAVDVLLEHPFIHH